MGDNLSRGYRRGIGSGQPHARVFLYWPFWNFSRLGSHCQQRWVEKEMHALVSVKFRHKNFLRQIWFVRVYFWAGVSYSFGNSRTVTFFAQKSRINFSANILVPGGYTLLVPKHRLSAWKIVFLNNLIENCWKQVKKYFMVSGFSFIVMYAKFASFAQKLNLKIGGGENFLLHADWVQFPLL